jgi:hypothetical protein
VHAAYKKILRSNASVFEGVLLADSGISDFGSGKKHSDALKIWDSLKSNPEAQQALVKEEQFTEAGEPLWHKGNAGSADFKLGEKITPDDDKVRTLLGVVKTEEGKTLKTLIYLKKDAVNIKMPLYKHIKFSGVKLAKSNNLQLVISSTNPNFMLMSIDEENVEALLKQYYGDCFVDIKDLDSYFEKIKGQPTRLSVFKGNVSEIVFTRGDKNNLVIIEHPDLGLGSEDGITCWVNKGYDMNISDGMVDVIVIGQPNRNALTNKITISAYGFYSRIGVIKPAPMTESKVWS